ncbi:MAG: hypothetical protein M1491_06520 [Deltaproteobacteria bacterium]|nr:hypothetical protein [Deltaproteobacteria bacterium]MCL5276250.1 hypothetical protein [Deltaproteobacteria bacterium]
MKKLLSVLSLLLTAGLLSSCGGTNTTNTSATNTIQYYNVSGTLQGRIMDAVTGEPIGGSDLKVFLIQGTSDRTPNKLITNPNDPLVGEYAFSGIPAEVYTHDITYSIVVVKPGYQGFTADVQLNASTFGFYYRIPLVDGVLNMIGNIYLFPVGTAPGNVNVYVYDPTGLPISNAEVMLEQKIANNNATAIQGDTLYPVSGLTASLQETTTSAGLATFNSSELTLGGLYKIAVPALTFNGEELETYLSPNPGFIVGTNSSTQVVYMTVAINSSELYAVSASNQVPGTITPSGVLTITFSQPITVSTGTFNVALSNGGTGAVAPTTSAVISNNDTTLTITPIFTTAVPSTQVDAYLTYTFAGTIILKNPQVPTTFTLFKGVGSDVKNITTGQSVSGVVQLTSY